MSDFYNLFENEKYLIISHINHKVIAKFKSITIITITMLCLECNKDVSDRYYARNNKYFCDRSCWLVYSSKIKQNMKKNGHECKSDCLVKDKPHTNCLICDDNGKIYSCHEHFS
jgi:hypothetical protein